MANVDVICPFCEQTASVVGNNKRQRWRWYAREPRLKRIIAHAFGSNAAYVLSGFRMAF
ncbi:MAG: IS1 family transposase, partial [Symbiopectobacterium sp.]|uniref:IS1 family transposase n=1 Tax=Symbiopectobacterium sp. TaxID=2952789 RepID=UPI003F319A5D